MSLPYASRRQSCWVISDAAGVAHSVYVSHKTAMSVLRDLRAADRKTGRTISRHSISHVPLVRADRDKTKE